MSKRVTAAMLAQALLDFMTKSQGEYEKKFEQFLIERWEIDEDIIMVWGEPKPQKAIGVTITTKGSDGETRAQREFAIRIEKTLDL